MKKTINISKAFLLFSLVLIIASAMADQADALIQTFEFDVTFSGWTPGGSSPYLKAIFDDSFGDANTVRLFMFADNLTATENVSQWYFNFNTNLDASNLIFTPVNNSASVQDSIQGKNNNFKPDGDGDYDILFDFPPPPGDYTSRFTTGETVTYDITYFSPIDISSFNFLSEGKDNKGSYFAAAHIQGINGNRSGWIGASTSTVIPEPISSFLFVIGGTLLAGRRFLKKRRNI